jgi:uncharacterized protein
MAESLGIPVAELIENPEKVNSVDYKAFETEAGKFTVEDIRDELLKPGRDPRDHFVLPKFRDDVRAITDLKEGMDLEGTVTNVTNFGAFVDLGVHQDGLVHISELSHRYIQDARRAVKVGDVVKVRVIGVDSTLKRIALSLKATQPKPKRPRPRRKGKPPAEASAPPVQAAAPPASERKPPPPIPIPIPRPLEPKSLRPVQKKAAAPAKSQVEKLAPPPPPPPTKLSMEEKIRLLQEKFGRTR